MKDTALYTSHEQNGILLNANELSKNLPPEILERIAGLIPEILFNRYPDDTYQTLLDAYARAMDLDAAQLLCGNGSDQMLGLMITTFLGKGKILYTLDPDFGMYDYYAASCEADVKKFPLHCGEDLDVDAFIENGRQLALDLILFSNPNNPCGSVVKKADLEKILAAFPDIPVVLDEAYMEFSDQSMLYELERWPNLYVTRTLSKAFGLAGLRVGFLASSRKNMEVLRPRKVVYAMSSLSAAIAALVLEYADEFRKTAEETKKRRDALQAAFENAENFVIHPSQANFVLIQSNRIEALLAAFRAAGITVRNYPGKDYLRLTIGSEEEMALAAQVLRDFQ